MATNEIHTLTLTLTEMVTVVRALDKSDDHYCDAIRDSRGAEHVTFLRTQRERVRVVRRRLAEMLQIGGRSESDETEVK
jgi:hypothetical protein